MSTMRANLFIAGLIIGCLPGIVRGGSMLIDLEQDINSNDIVHGQIIDNEFFPPLSVNAVNVSSGPDLAIIFDSRVPYNPALPLQVGNEGKADPDLLGPPTNGRTWAMGNIDPDEELGNLLIIAEHPAFGNPDANGDGIIDTFPDDEGSRPAGSIFFNFDSPITSIGFDLVDVEGSAEILEDAGYVAAFFMGGTLLGEVSFGDFVDPLSSFYDPTIQFGDNSANRIQPITAAQLGGTSFDMVEFSLGGSGGITNIVYSMPDSVIPEPSSWALAAMGCTALLGFHWRRRRTRR